MSLNPGPEKVREDTKQENFCFTVLFCVSVIRERTSQNLFDIHF